VWHARELATRATADDAQRLAAAIARELGLPPALAPAFEAPARCLHDEVSLPLSADPRRAGLDDPAERRRLAQIFHRGAGAPVGWALPLARSTTGTWLTAQWTFRRANLFLLPRDSPVGLRRPLASLG